jgi:AbrB family looped-hinge helix DNA binding protein
METTTLSSKGQIIIPKAVRRTHGWQAGMKFQVEDTPEGLLLRPGNLFPLTRLEDGIGCTGYKGPAMTVEEMREGIDEELRKTWKRGVDK